MVRPKPCTASEQSLQIGLANVGAFVGLCHAELSALLPIAGSTYTYTYAMLGEVFSWIIGFSSPPPPGPRPSSATEA
jgi:hypothetical protein